MATTKKKDNTNWINFKEIKANADFGEVLRYFNIPITKPGEQIKVTCPFHQNDSDPSLSIDMKGKKFKCFGCDEQGNILDFVQKMKKLKDTRAAAFYLRDEITGKDVVVANEQNKNIDQTPTKTGEVYDNQRPDIIPHGTQYIGDGLLKILGEQSEPVGKGKDLNDDDGDPGNLPLGFRLKLSNDHPYLVERGIDEVVARKYGVGYCNRGYLKNRICFPIHNFKYELVGYVGRWADDDIPEDTPRYLVPQKFNKSSELYLYTHHFPQYTQMHPQTVILVEGFWSAIYLSEMGFRAISLMGNKISENAIHILANDPRISDVIILMDNDEAGKKTEEGNLKLLSRHVPTRVYNQNTGTKPDEIDNDEGQRLSNFMEQQHKSRMWWKRQEIIFHS